MNTFIFAAIPGYEILEKIPDCPRTRVYRNQQKQTKLQLLSKLCYKLDQISLFLEHNRQA
ncbi:hypothetical protein NIES2109_17640 [Nostoc sp. HK-01]|uniref:Serine/threonine protein kinase n=1 Tax=Nostoc cycadae WK-1 TaxID=1861711 RepID=A0A2H6LF80_9NOSO|nr:hypothetical protein [Nostoc cycadae]BBD58985.1 hypothetical protein NIES2109_17640 [Nostoc sp. HK-01]GBE91872.1 serine/threonine protein kinase [Nostoc cycadae WK-1]